MAARFTDLLDGLDNFEIEFDRLPAILGRGDAATVSLKDPWVSRQHCQVQVDGQELVVVDLASRHGTFVNGQRVAKANLAPGDQLQVGIHLFSVGYLAKELGNTREPSQRKALA